MKVREDRSRRPKSPACSFDSRPESSHPSGTPPGGEFAQGPSQDIFFTPKEAAAYLRVSKSYLDKLRVYGGGPRFLRLGKRKVLYRKSDLNAWLASQSFNSTSQYAAPASSATEELSNNRQHSTTIIQARSGKLRTTRAEYISQRRSRAVPQCTRELQ